REGLGRARPAALRGQDHRPARGRDPRGDEVRLRQGARLRPRGRLDRRRPLDGASFQGARVLPGPVPARARLPRSQRELRLAAGRRRDGRLRGLLPPTLRNVDTGGRAGRPCDGGMMKLRPIRLLLGLCLLTPLGLLAQPAPTPTPPPARDALAAQLDRIYNQAAYKEKK